ncbi:MAG: hypothetical protein AABZ06_15335 [Bdellovibrionota bacterium]
MKTLNLVVLGLLTITSLSQADYWEEVIDRRTISSTSVISLTEGVKVTLQQCAVEMNTSVDLLKKFFVVDQSVSSLKKILESQGIELSSQTECNSADYRNAELILQTCFEKVKQSFPDKAMTLPKVLLVADYSYGDNRGKVRVEEAFRGNQIVAISIIIDRESTTEGCYNTVVTKFLK